MKKIIIFFMIIANVISFSLFDKIKSEIKWKEEEVPKFKKIEVIKNGVVELKDILPGEYKIKLFELNYPKTLFEKNNFYNKFSEIFEKSQKGVKYSLLLENRFYEDIKKISLDELFDEEKILEYPASSLFENEKKELKNLSNEISISEYAGTDQEILNRQIYILYKLLERNDFDKNEVYSELQKEYLIADLKLKRKKIVEDFKNSKIEYFVKESYDNIDLDRFQDRTNYKLDKDIIISKKIEDQSIFPDIKNNLYLTDFPKDIIKRLSENKLKLKKNILILENNQFYGYTYNENNVVIFVNGENPLYYYKDFKIDVEVKKIDIYNLLNENSEYNISDFFSE